jgi:radical SAM superfamily enzyme YgiQ (UPF0313 family)
MGKPPVKIYNKFIDAFTRINKELQMNQYAVPYLMSSHPGSTLRDAIALACYLNEHHLNPEQVQDFYPTPSTISTCMYYTGYDPVTMRPVYVAKNPHEKAMQRALIQFKNPRNYELVREALVLEKRTDLIGYGKECLIPPRKNTGAAKKKTEGKPSAKKKNRT